MLQSRKLKRTTVKRASGLLRVLLTLTPVMLLTACGPAPLVSVPSLKGAIDASATMACGLTRSDQQKIDKTTESGARAGVWDRPKQDPVCKGQHR